MKISIAKEIRFGLLLMTLLSLSSFTFAASEGSHDPSGTWVWDSEFQGETVWKAKRTITNKDLVGTWSLHINGPDGVTYTPDAIFKLSDGSLTGMYNAASLDQKLPMSMVELDGEELTFAVDQSGLKLNYVGTVSGKNISGNLEFDIQGNSGDVAFTGTLAE